MSVEMTRDLVAAVENIRVVHPGKRMCVCVARQTRSFPPCLRGLVIILINLFAWL